MSFSRDNLKQFFFPVYYVWAFISPSIILLINPIELNVIPAFYALFGLIWPLSYVVYPAFLISINAGDTAMGAPGAVFLFFVAWLGPLVHLIFATLRHKKYISNKKQGDENLSWPDYLSGFI